MLGRVDAVKPDASFAETATLRRFETAAASDPYNVEAVYNLAIVLDQMGELERARSAYERFIKLDSDEYRNEAARARERLIEIDRLIAAPGN